MNDDPDSVVRWPIIFKESNIFDQKELRQEEIEYLQKNQYTIHNLVPIGEKRQRPFLIKTNTIESPQHTFLVWNTKKILQKHTNEIQTKLTKKPDLIFKTPDGQKNAIEIETGIGYKKHKTRLQQKTQKNNKEYGTNWFILCAKSKMTKQYKKYGKAISRTQLTQYLQQLFENTTVY